MSINYQHLAISRRSFLRLGVVGAATVASVGTVASLSGCSQQPTTLAKGFSFLRTEDLALFTALIPVVLGNLVQTDSHNYQALVVNILKGVDGACANLGVKAQGEIYKLLDLLAGRITRWLTTGIYGDWIKASPDDMNNFLARWHGSSIAPFNAGYRVLSKLVSVSYFGLPESRQHAGYSPLAMMYQAVNS
ncbi:hypothetical protein [Agitococcus lubricus]|uniref:Twin-arginine translocation pathway signal protein n=1 Tax=Agitococcus lubricus TaxID=1077255 RepID=A0A2T5IWU0_9GAMM|nr:hypothetical protein [Agitococcus lubricus]PTQ88407.1 hypothetical protein C8N29_11252 [Agitococcus lubricus]